MSERPSTWTAWAWRRSAWVRLGEAPTLAQCSALAEQKRGATPAYRTMCKGGSEPPRWRPRAGNWAGE